MSKKTVSVKLHYYSTSIGPRYTQVCDEIRANDVPGRGHQMRAIATDQDRKGRSREDDAVETVEIDLKHLFGNQCNTTDGRRIFDWWEEYTQTSYRRGHWIEVTEELAQARRDALRCGYCGHTYGPNHDGPPPADGFCEHCLDSAYLKPKAFQMIRLAPVIEPEAERPPLTEEELAALMPRYLEAQTRGNAARAAERRAKERQRIEDDRKRIYEKVIPAAEAEYKGKLWLWEHEISLDNVIYYNHTGRFCFGWRSKLSQEVASKLLDVLCEFPFDYDINKE